MKYSLKILKGLSEAVNHRIEDTKGIIRSRKSQNRFLLEKGKNTDQENTTQINDILS